MIIQGSNIPLLIKCENNMSDIQDIKLIFYRFPNDIIKEFNREDIQIENDTVKIPLSQELTTNLPHGVLLVEMKWLSSDGLINFAEPIKIDIGKRIDKRFLEGKIVDTVEEIKVNNLKQYSIKIDIADLDNTELNKIIEDYFELHFEDLKPSGGNGIKDITTSKNADVTTVTFALSDGTKKSFTVKDGNPGKDAVSPTAKVERTSSGALITITDFKGTTKVELKDGNSSGENSLGGTNGLSAYEIAVKNGFIGDIDEWLESLKGNPGYTPIKGVDYYTPQEISEIITTIQNSVSNGKDGIGISDITTSKSNGVTTVTIKLTDGTTKSFTVKDGADGIDGKDYVLTVEDKTEIVNDVINEIPVNNNNSVTVSDTQPEDENVVLWINPNGEVGEFPNISVTSISNIFDIIDYRVDYGKTYTENGGLTDKEKVSYIPYDNLIPVKENEQYKIIGSGSNIYSFDENKHLIGKVVGNPFVITSDIKYIGGTFWQGLTAKIYKIINSTIVDDYRNFIINQMKKEQNYQHNVVKPKFKPLDKGYITLGVDDCNRADFATLVQRYLEADIPLCFSYCGNEGYCIRNVDSSFWGKTDVSVDEIIERALEKGGEVLCHHAKQMTQEMLEDFDICYEHFVSMKNLIESKGWECNGIILAGGTGQVVGSPISDMWVRNNFLYSDLYGEEKYKEPYYHRRGNLMHYNNDLEGLKTAITKAMINKEWLVFYQHDFSEFSEDNLISLLSWINEQGYEVNTYKEVYDKLITYEYNDIPNFDGYYTKAEIDSIVANITNTPVQGITLVSIEVSKLKTDYDTTEIFSTDDITVMATYSDGTVTDVTSFSNINSDNVNPTQEGTYNITVSYTYGDKTLTDNIEITVVNEGWDEVVDFVLTENRDKIAFGPEYNYEKGKKYRISFDYKYDASNLPNNIICYFYNWSIGLNISVRFIAGTTDIGSIDVEVTANQTDSYKLAVDDQNNGSTIGSIKLFFKNITIDEITE